MVYLYDLLYSLTVPSWIYLLNIFCWNNVSLQSVANNLESILDILSSAQFLCFCNFGYFQIHGSFREPLFKHLYAKVLFNRELFISYVHTVVHKCLDILLHVPYEMYFSEISNQCKIKNYFFRKIKYWITFF